MQWGEGFARAVGSCRHLRGEARGESRLWGGLGEDQEFHSGHMSFDESTRNPSGDVKRVTSVSVRMMVLRFTRYHSGWLAFSETCFKEKKCLRHGCSDFESNPQGRVYAMPVFSIDAEPSSYSSQIQGHLWEFILSQETFGTVLPALTITTPNLF